MHPGESTGDCHRRADYGRLSPERAAWQVFGNIAYRDEPEVESGQVVIDKARCWRALTFASWCGERSAFFFQHVHGDKELFHLCWRKLGQEYAMPSRGIVTLPGTMCQHDFDGSRQFQHRNGRKWSLGQNPQVPGFEREAECVRFIDELKCNWSPAAQTLPTDADRAAIAAMDGRRFEYHRVGYDHRPMVFRGDGTFGSAELAGVDETHVHVAHLGAVARTKQHLPLQTWARPSIPRRKSAGSIATRIRI